MSTLPENILQCAQSLPEGSVLSPKEFLHQGSRAAVRALAWIGPAHANESLASLHCTLPSAEWKALASARATDIDLTYDIRKLIPDLIGDGRELPSSRSQADKWTKAVRHR